jgi:hypothetical protein
VRFDRIARLPKGWQPSTSPADASPALAEPVVLQLYLEVVDRPGPGIVDDVRFAFGGERLFLTVVTRLAIDPGVDEPALLHGSRRGRGADHGGKQNKGRKLHGQPMRIDNRGTPASSFEERREILDHEIAGQVHDGTVDHQRERESTHSRADFRDCIVGLSSPPASKREVSDRARRLAM